MGILKTKAYKSLKKHLDEAREKQFNLAVVSLPGMGSSYYLKHYCKQDKSTGYINRSEMKLARFSVLDFKLEKDNELEIIDGYFKQAKIDQKMAVVINRPFEWQSERLKRVALFGHIYKRCFFGAADLEDTILICQEFGVDKKRAGEIYDTSGGIRKIVKYLCLNPKADSSDEKLRELVLEIAEIVQGCSSDDLKELALIDENSDFRSKLIREVFESGEVKLAIRIKIDDDLNFKEMDQKNGNRLTLTEKAILEELIGKRIINRQKIAEIKWGKDSYDEFSDQAITKTMERLAVKLKKYQIKAIPKLGYELTAK